MSYKTFPPSFNEIERISQGLHLQLIWYVSFTSPVGCCYLRRVSSMKKSCIKDKTDRHRIGAIMFYNQVVDGDNNTPTSKPSIIIRNA